jgi:hypothetical protein
LEWPAIAPTEISNRRRADYTEAKKKQVGKKTKAIPQGSIERDYSGATSFDQDIVEIPSLSQAPSRRLLGTPEIVKPVEESPTFGPRAAALPTLREFRVYLEDIPRFEKALRDPARTAASVGEGLVDIGAQIRREQWEAENLSRFVEQRRELLEFYQGQLEAEANRLREQFSVAGPSNSQRVLSPMEREKETVGDGDRDDEEEEDMTGTQR